MGEVTKIEWAQHTWSPWIGCTKLSPACGALVHALVSRPEVARAYLDGATAKITVAAKNAEALERIHRDATGSGIPVCLVTDAGRTVFPEPTLTVCAFGPCLRTDLPPYLARLQLLKG